MNFSDERESIVKIFNLVGDTTPSKGYGSFGLFSTLDKAKTAGNNIKDQHWNLWISEVELDTQIEKQVLMIKHTITTDPDSWP